MTRPAESRSAAARKLRFVEPVAPRRSIIVGRFLLSFITLGMLAVLHQVGRLQLQPSAQIQPLVNSQSSSEDLLARKGNIVDRSGRVLATTCVANQLFVDPYLIQDPNTFSEQLARDLDFDDPAEIEKRIAARTAVNPHIRYVVIDKELTRDRYELAQKLRLPAVATEQRLKRNYPQGSLAGQLIGFIGHTGDGVEGLEQSLNRHLAGTTGEMKYWRDAARRPLWVYSEGYRLPEDGQAVRLSLDLTIQSIAEEQLAATCKQYNAPSGQVVVMHPYTGEILAMANYPFFDPIQGGNVPDDLRRNRCITDAFEPGSTFKPFIWAMAVQGGFARPDEVIDGHNGYYRSPKGRVLHDAHGYGPLTYTRGLVKSSNIIMAIVGQRMGSAKLYEAVRTFGFGAKTGIPIPRESVGIVNPLKSWTHYSETSVPMGQEVAVTPLQLARAFCVLANGGMMISPTLDPVDDPAARAPIFERILTPHTAEVTKEALRLVVTEGTGRKADSKLYPIFGKTGTAQVADHKKGGFLPDAYTAVFVCGAPVEQPRLVVTVVIHQPKGEIHTGGLVAAPAAKEIVERSLTYLGELPITPAEPDQLASR